MDLKNHYQWVPSETNRYYMSLDRTQSIKQTHKEREGKKRNLNLITHLFIEIQKTNILNHGNAISKLIRITNSVLLNNKLQRRLGLM